MSAAPANPVPPSEPTASQIAATSAAPGWVAPADSAPKKRISKTRFAIIAFLVIIVLGAIGQVSKGGQASSDKQLSGAFVGWEPVDDANGYADISITNHGTASATAMCKVNVSDDFGDFGFDQLVGEEVGAGQTFTGRIPISVGKGSYLINKGTVTEC